MYEDIEREFEYGGKDKKTAVRYFPERNISTIAREIPETDPLEYEIIREGMTREEILKFFKKGKEANLALLLRSIIYEASEKEGIEREEGNVRNFWYSHVKYAITELLGLPDDESMISSLNQAWKAVINSGLVSYEGMNIRGGKEETRLTVCKDSPFGHIIMGLEKQDYYNEFKWIPRLFHDTLITAGGQPSRTVSRAFIYELDDLGIDLDEDFYLCMASDLDPAGYYIQEAFRDQIESAIKYYGGEGKVQIKRLFVRKDQVGPTLLKYAAMPCADNLPPDGRSAEAKKKRETAMKKEDTKWAFFVEQTEGGLYKNVPAGHKGRVFCSVCHLEYGHEDCSCGSGPMVRALLEMNAFSKETIEKTLIKQLLSIIEETSDESKIMIPEIMRVFEIMREEASEEVFREWHEKIIKPLIERFLKQTERWARQIRLKHWEDIQKAEKIRDDKFQPIDEKFDDLEEEKEQEIRDRMDQAKEQCQKEIDEGAHRPKPKPDDEEEEEDEDD